MFIGQLKLSRNGRSYTYHRLLESVRTDKGPRQRLVLSLGTLVDGATKLQRIIHIDIPGIVPTAIVLLILRVGRLSAGWPRSRWSD